jgi:hypothetical protein
MRGARPIPEPSSDGRIRQPSWGRLGLEVITDLFGWLVVFAVLQAIGTKALQKVTGTTLLGELVIVLILFFAVTVVVRVGFILLARRTIGGPAPEGPPDGPEGPD